MPQLIGSDGTQRAAGEPVGGVDKCMGGFTPQCVGDSRGGKHGDNALSQVSVGALLHSILLRGCLNSVLTLNPMCLHEEIKLGGHVFTSLVITQLHESPASVLLCICFELLESIKCITLLLEQAYPPIPGVVINEQYPVLVARGCSGMQRAMEIGMHKFQELSAATGRCSSDRAERGKVVGEIRLKEQILGKGT
jgi:hypothetical protein